MCYYPSYMQDINSSCGWCKRKQSTVNNADERDPSASCPWTSCIWPGAAQVVFADRNITST